MELIAAVKKIRACESEAAAQVVLEYMMKQAIGAASTYQPYDEQNANTTDRVAWVLCQIIDDDAPLRWTRYRGVAECLANSFEAMDALITLRRKPK